VEAAAKEGLMSIRASLIALVSLSACRGSSSIYTQGELGHAEFGWNNGLGCAIAAGFASSGLGVKASGCDASAPMATRASADLQVVNSSKLPAFDAASNDTSIADATAGGSAIRIVSHRAGTIELSLTNHATGELIDRLPIVIEDVATIALADSSSYKVHYLIENGGSDIINLTLKDHSGSALVGLGAVDYSLAGALGAQQVTLVSALADLLVGATFGVEEHVSITALQTGAGTIAVSAPSGAALAIPAEVDDASAIATITVSGRAPLQAGSAVIFDAVAGDSSGERVHSPACAWSVQPASGPIAIDWQLRDSLQLKAASSASATLTCSAGTSTGSVPVAAK
jgi:hypothetical protein